MVIGDPGIPALDQSFSVVASGAVLPNLILCPNLPSIIVSPSYGKILAIDSGSKYSPNGRSFTSPLGLPVKLL